MNRLLLSMLLVVSLLAVGCAQEQPVSTNNQSTDITGTTDTTDTNNDDSDNDTTNYDSISGGFVDISTDKLTFDEFYTHTTNDVSNIKLKLDMRKNSNDTYSGKAYIYFTDRGQTSRLTFHSGGEQHSQYNRWINNGAQFHAIFDDFKTGMLVVTIDRVYDLGDGLGAEDAVDGSVFFYNYPIKSQYGVQPLLHPQAYGYDKYCWTATAGTYQCHPWKDLNHANTQTWPDANIQLLGRFEGLSLEKALNLED